MRLLLGAIIYEKRVKIQDFCKKYEIKLLEEDRVKIGMEKEWMKSHFYRPTSRVTRALWDPTCPFLPTVWPTVINPTVKSKRSKSPTVNSFNALTLAGNAPALAENTRALKPGPTVFYLGAKFIFMHRILFFSHFLLATCYLHSTHPQIIKKHNNI